MRVVCGMCRIISGGQREGVPAFVPFERFSGYCIAPYLIEETARVYY